MKTALITGAAGQDGILLSRSLLADGYRVIGTVRDPGSVGRLATYAPGVEVRQLDIRDREGLGTMLRVERPDEIYNLASWSSVGQSWAHPWQVTEVNGLAVLGLMEELLSLHRSDDYHPRVCQASSSEMFGLSQATFQDETTGHHPRSPYATAKSFAHHTIVNYRESYGIFVCGAVLFNHESPLRPSTFVTRKITSGVAAIRLGRRDRLTLGRLDIRRDWGSADEFIVAMRRMLALPEPTDVCIATGVSHSLADFVNAAFLAVGIEDGLDRVEIDPLLHRPAEVMRTRGDAARAKEILGWQPERTFEGLVAWMVGVDIQRALSDVEDDPTYLALEHGTSISTGTTFDRPI